MPKLPLFAGQPLDPGFVAALRAIFVQPEVGENMALINDLLDLHSDPHSPMSKRWAALSLNLGLTQSVMLDNFLMNTLTVPRLSGKRGAMRFQINQRLLAHAAAAGFNPCGGSRVTAYV